MTIGSLQVYKVWSFTHAEEDANGIGVSVQLGSFVFEWWLTKRVGK